MTVATFAPYVYAIFTLIVHLPGPGPLMTNPAAIAIGSILLNLLLALAILRTPELRKAEYAGFLAE